jgi:hypothetical protein
MRCPRSTRRTGGPRQHPSMRGLPLAGQAAPNLQQACCQIEPILQRSWGPPGGPFWLQVQSEPATGVLQVRAIGFHQGKTWLPYSSQQPAIDIALVHSAVDQGVFTRASTLLAGENSACFLPSSAANPPAATISVGGQQLTARRKTMSTQGAKNGFSSCRWRAGGERGVRREKCLSQLSPRPVVLCDTTQS